MPYTNRYKTPEEVKAMRPDALAKLNDTTTDDELTMFDINEIASILELNTQTIYRYVQNKKMKFVKIGGKWKISKANLKKYLNGEQ